MGIVELKEGTIIIRQGGQMTRITVEKTTGGGELVKKRPPKNAIMSLLPVLEELYGLHPSVMNPDWADWAEITQEAKYKPEEAINLLRRHGFSVEEVSDSLLDMALNLAVRFGQERDQSKELLGGWVDKKIRALYASTVEVTGSSK